MDIHKRKSIIKDKARQAPGSISEIATRLISDIEVEVIGAAEYCNVGHAMSALAAAMDDMTVINRELADIRAKLLRIPKELKEDYELDYDRLEAAEELQYHLYGMISGDAAEAVHKALEENCHCKLIIE